MCDRGTFKPNDSISSHSKDSMDIINHIVELSISCMRDLANPHEGTFVDMTFNKFMCALEHIRETIETWESLCDELEADSDELRETISKITADCPYRGKYCDYPECGDCHFTKNRDKFIKELWEQLDILRKDEAHWHKLAVERNKELGNRTRECNSLKNQIADLIEERDYYQDCLHKLANRASNFCGNCANCEQHSSDVYVCKHSHTIIDPDESSCLHFKSNEQGKVVIGKPEFPCCEHCSHEDCSVCTLCPF